MIKKCAVLLASTKTKNKKTTISFKPVVLNKNKLTFLTNFIYSIYLKKEKSYINREQML